MPLCASFIVTLLGSMVFGALSHQILSVVHDEEESEDHSYVLMNTIALC